MQRPAALPQPAADQPKAAWARPVDVTDLTSNHPMGKKQRDYAMEYACEIGGLPSSPLSDLSTIVLNCPADGDGG